MATWKILLVIVGGLTLATPAAFWLGGGKIADWSYQPPPFDGGWYAAIHEEAKARGVELLQTDPWKEQIGFVKNTQTRVYRGEWSATKGGQPIIVTVAAKGTPGKWEVATWIER